VTIEQKRICGKVLTELRTSTPFSQQAFADICEFDVTFLRRLETGKSEPGLMTLVKIARRLGMKPGKLLDTIIDRMEAEGVLSPFL